MKPPAADQRESEENSMTPLQLLKAGNVSEVLSKLQHEVRDNPSDPKGEYSCSKCYVFWVVGAEPSLN